MCNMCNMRNMRNMCNMCDICDSFCLYFRSIPFLIIDFNLLKSHASLM